MVLPPAVPPMPACLESRDEIFAFNRESTCRSPVIYRHVFFRAVDNETASKHAFAVSNFATEAIRFLRFFTAEIASLGGRSDIRTQPQPCSDLPIANRSLLLKRRSLRTKVENVSECQIWPRQ